jgi:ring-1,2-phenylacetyl-CoA epoxidase subunit PaaE
MALHFHALRVKRITPDAAGSAAITFSVPPDLRSTFDFKPGQFLTLRAMIDGNEARRSYSICSSHQRLLDAMEIDVGIKPVEGGQFSTWAINQLVEGASIEVLPPDGRFTPRLSSARHRVGFAAGSGITPILSIIATTLAEDTESRFTLVYGNQRVNTIMFHEALQDLKDRYPARLSLVHVLSRQPQEIALLNGRLDETKVAQLLERLLPAESIDEAFVCGPEGMIACVEKALHACGVPMDRIRSERFFSADNSAIKRPPLRAQEKATPSDQGHSLHVVLDGKTHHMQMSGDVHVLDAALEAGLDLPYSCRGGVCCTCRARVLEGEVTMDKNFTLEQWEIDKGFVLTCQARPVTPEVRVSYDDR